MQHYYDSGEGGREGCNWKLAEDSLPCDAAGASAAQWLVQHCSVKYSHR